MIDGAMYPTRENGEPWKEIKMGKVFKSNDILTQTFIKLSER